jgi:hypothetical protein
MNQIRVLVQLKLMIRFMARGIVSSPYDTNSNSNPGPGTYHGTDTIFPVSIRIDSPSREERREDTPGPGTYEPNPSFSSTQAGGQIHGSGHLFPYDMNSDSTKMISCSSI